MSNLPEIKNLQDFEGVFKLPRKFDLFFEIELFVSIVFLVQFPTLYSCMSHIHWTMKYIQKIEYVRDLVPSCRKVLVRKIGARKIIIFIKITVSGIKKTI